MEKQTLRKIENVVEEEIKKFLGRECRVRVIVSAEGITEKVEIENVTETERDYISEKLGIPLDILTSGKVTEEELRTQNSLVNLLNWCARLSKPQLDDACAHMAALIRLIWESCV